MKRCNDARRPIQAQRLRSRSYSQQKLGRVDVWRERKATRPQRVVNPRRKVLVHGIARGSFRLVALPHVGSKLREASGIVVGAEG